MRVLVGQLSPRQLASPLRPLGRPLQLVPLLLPLLLEPANSERLSGSTKLQHGSWGLVGVFGLDPGEGTIELTVNVNFTGGDLAHILEASFCESTFSEITGGDVDTKKLTGSNETALDRECCAYCRLNSRCQFWVRSSGGKGSELCWLKHTPGQTLDRKDRRGGWKQPSLETVIERFGLEALLVPARPGDADGLAWREAWRMRAPRPCSGGGGLDPRGLAPQRYSFDDLGATVSLRQSPQRGMWFVVLSACGPSSAQGVDSLVVEWAFEARNNGSESSCDARWAAGLASLGLLVAFLALCAALCLAPAEAPKRGVALAALLACLGSGAELLYMDLLPGSAGRLPAAAAIALVCEVLSTTALPFAALLSSLDGPRLGFWCSAAPLHAMISLKSLFDILGPGGPSTGMAPLVHLGRWRTQVRPLSMDAWASLGLCACGASLLAWHRASGDSPRAWLAGSLAALGPPAVRALGRWVPPADAAVVSSVARPLLAGAVYWLLLRPCAGERKSRRRAVVATGVGGLLLGPSVTLALYLALSPPYREVVLTEAAPLRIYMIAVTSRFNIQKARQLQSSLRRRMGPDDRLAFACRSRCAKEAAGVLENIVKVPELPDHFHNIRKCRHAQSKAFPKGKECTEYEIASIKYVWALVGEVRRINASKLPNYKWWMIMDDDTYVHVPNLMRVIDRTTKDGRPLHETLVSYANHEPGCPGICGGGGWLLSGALAEALVRDFGDAYIRFSMDQLYNGSFYYDVHVPKVVKWVKGALNKDLPEMMGFSPGDPICEGRGLKPKLPWKCVPAAACNCSKAAKPATWHLKGNITQHLAVLDATP